MVVAGSLMTELRPDKRIHVAVGVILDERGHVLVARRAEQQHLGGLWEFPGGKLEPGENVQQALYRELKEELAIEVQQSQPLCQIEHNYPEKSVLLDVWIVNRFIGEPTGVEKQPLRWLPPAQLDPALFPPANRLIIRRLQLRDQFAIINLPGSSPPGSTTPGWSPPGWSQDSAWVPHDALVRLRCQHKDRYDDYLAAARTALPALVASTAGVIVDLSPAHVATDCLVRQDVYALDGFKGLHAHSGLLQTMTVRPVPDHLLFGVSCHTREELALALALDADYALLSPVKSTPTHPDGSPLGWDEFETLTAASPVPVYALGGMMATDLANARARGGRGIAGISLFSSGTMR